MSWLRVLLFLVFCVHSISVFSVSKISQKLCEDSLLPASGVVPRHILPTHSWLRENMLLGFERTYTNRALEDFMQNLGEYAPQKKQVRRWNNIETNSVWLSELELMLSDIRNKENKKVFRKAHVAQVTRFIEKVIQPTELVFYALPHSGKTKLKTKLNYLPHLQAYYAEARLASGNWITFSLEPGCIEINQNPVGISEVKAAWSDFDQRAKANGFVHKTHLSSGGGTHLHIGWKNQENNLWLRRPDLLAKILKLPLLVKAFFYILNNRADSGLFSNVATPFDYENSEVHVLKNFESFVLGLNDLVYKGIYAPQEVLNFFRSGSIPYFLGDHYSYISLKNIGEENPRIEIRFHDSFETTEQLQAVANFWLSLIHRLEFLNLDPILLLSITTSYSETSPKYLEIESLNLLEGLKKNGLTDDDIEQLKQINQIGTQENQHHRVNNRRNSKLKLQSTTEYLPAKGLLRKLELNVVNHQYPERTKLVLLDTNSFTVVSLQGPTNVSSFPLTYLPLTKQKKIGFYLDSESHEVLHAFVIEIDATNGDEVKIEIGGDLARAIARKENFIKTFFYLGVRRLGDMSYDKELNPHDQETSNNYDYKIERDILLSCLIPYLRTFPGFVDALKSDYFSKPQTLSTLLSIPYNNKSISDVLVIVNGKEVKADKEFGYYSVDIKVTLPIKALTKSEEGYYVIIEYKLLSGLGKKRESRSLYYWTIWNLHEQTASLYPYIPPP